MSNVAGKAYGMNVITPMRPCWTWVNRFLFMFARAVPSTLFGLLGLQLIHFARWAIIKRDQWPDLGQGKQTLQNDYMLFCSNFNGTWDQYIDAFADGIPSGLDLFWYSSTKYPHRSRSRHSRITFAPIRSTRIITIMRRPARRSATSKQRYIARRTCRLSRISPRCRRTIRLRYKSC